jgi:hypothetical protein
MLISKTCWMLEDPRPLVFCAEAGIAAPMSPMDKTTAKILFIKAFSFFVRELGWERLSRR